MGPWRRWIAGLMSLLVAGPALAAEPTLGHSLFQQVFTAADGRAEIPFPFEALLARLKGELVPGRGLRDGLPLVVIPLGRSLQRHAAEDAGYFAYPRVVLAVTGEPHPGAPLLRDRLYIGYHALQRVLEVISYNEAAGRFEFQLVRDYRPGGRPRLVQARRELCMACHQDGTPIFSRQTWDETAASPALAPLLEAALAPALRGLPWRGGVDVPNAIDDATERANRLILAQRLWDEGCGSGGPGAAACRGALWFEALRQRLKLPDLAGPAGGMEAALATLGARWPEGLALPNPDIPNRLPLASLDPDSQAHPSPAQLRRVADVAAPFDPLALRPPRERWDPRRPGAGAEAALAVGQILAEADLAAVHKALARRPAPLVERPATGCQVTGAGAEGGARVYRLRCAEPRLQARLVWRGRQVRGELESLELPGAAVLRGPLAGEAREQEGQVRLSLKTAPRPLAGLDLAWPGGEGPAAVSLRLEDPAAVLRQAVAEQPGLEAAGPLLRGALVPALLDRLGSADPGCCGRAGPLPPVPAEPVRLAPPGLGPELAALFRNCGACHDSSDAFPPGFLRGEGEALLRRVGACAPRMVYRLAMGSLPAGARPKTPMPPPFSAHGPGFAGSGDYRLVLPWLETLAQARSETLLQRPYADLAPCRPALD